MKPLHFDPDFLSAPEAPPDDLREILESHDIEVSEELISDLENVVQDRALARTASALKHVLVHLDHSPTATAMRALVLGKQASLRELAKGRRYTWMAVWHAQKRLLKAIAGKNVTVKPISRKIEKT